MESDKQNLGTGRLSFCFVIASRKASFWGLSTWDVLDNFTWDRKNLLAVLLLRQSLSAAVGTGIPSGVTDEPQAGIAAFGLLLSSPQLRCLHYGYYACGTACAPVAAPASLRSRAGSCAIRCSKSRRSASNSCLAWRPMASRSAWLSCSARLTAPQMPCIR
jgi:hypothetical protein